MIDDLEIPSTGQLLELDQGKVRFDPGRIAIHDETDRTGRRDHGDLRVAVSVSGSEFQGAIPSPSCGDQEIRRTMFGLNARRCDRESLEFLPRRAIGGATVIANDAQHGVSVLGIPGERPEFSRHFRRCTIGLTGHDGGERSTDGERLLRVIRDALPHQNSTEIGVSQAEGAELIALFGDRAARERRHEDTDLKHDRPDPDCVAEVF